MKRAEDCLPSTANTPAPPPLNFNLGTAQRRPNCRALIGGDAPPTCTNALPAPGRSAQRPPGGDLRLLRDRKIATRLKRDGAESLGFCGRGCGRRQHSTPTKGILICFL